LEVWASDAAVRQIQIRTLFSLIYIHIGIYDVEDYINDRQHCVRSQFLYDFFLFFLTSSAARATSQISFYTL